MWVCHPGCGSICVLFPRLVNQKSWFSFHLYEADLWVKRAHLLFFPNTGPFLVPGDGQDHRRTRVIACQDWRRLGCAKWGREFEKKKKNSWFSGTSALENKTGAVHLCRYAPYCHRSLENNRCACLMCCEFKHFPPSLITMFEVPLSIALTKVLSGQWFETVVCTGQLPVVLWTRVTKRQRAPESGHSGSNRLVVNKGREADSEFIG